MVNEIAAFFEADPDRNAVLEGVAGHLKRFWDPRMRREILTYVDEQKGAGLKQVVLDALRNHRLEIAPKESNSKPA